MPSQPTLDIAVNFNHQQQHQHQQHRQQKPGSMTDGNSSVMSFDSWDYHQPSLEGTLSTAASDCSFETETPSFEDDIHVSISGVSFNLCPHVFDKLKRLPWQYSEDADVDYHMHAAPHLFEILVHHALFGSLPQIRHLSNSDIEELVPLSMVLGWKGMQSHLEGSKKLFRRRFGNGGGHGVGKSPVTHKLTSSSLSQPESTGMPKRGSATAGTLSRIKEGIFGKVAK